jgi:hypothetical protein
MRTFQVTMTYEVEIVDDEPPTMLHLMDAVYQMQANDTPYKGKTNVLPVLDFRTEEISMSTKELEA